MSVIRHSTSLLWPCKNVNGGRYFYSQLPVCSFGLVYEFDEVPTFFPISESLRLLEGEINLYTEFLRLAHTGYYYWFPRFICVRDNATDMTIRKLIFFVDKV